MHKFLREDRIALELGQVTRIVNARPFGAAFYEDVDVYKEIETGEEYVQNLYLCPLSGYLVDFPDEACMDGGRRGADGWYEPNIKIGKYAFETCSPISDSERNLILEKYPDFKWVLSKWQGSRAQTMKVLKIWKRHKEIEFPLSLGYYNIAVNENFYRSDNRDVARYLVKNRPDKWMPLCDIQMMLRRGIDCEELKRYKTFCQMRKLPYDDYKYLVKIGMANFRGAGIYYDYKESLKRAGRSLKDPYWRFPNDLPAACEKVLEEVKRKEEMERLAKVERERKEREEKARLYAEKVREFSRLNSIIDGYAVYVPETAEDWLIQAKALHQCIVAANYMGKVMSGKCLIVFVRKEGKPVATAEVFSDGTLGQFYADELDRRSCLPGDEIKEVMNKWLCNFKQMVSAKMLAA